MMKVMVLFILFFVMMFSLEFYLNNIEQDIQNSDLKKDNIASNTDYIELTSWINPFQF